MKEYVLGFDYGTASCRVICADISNGEEIYTKSIDYPSGIIDTVFHPTGEKLQEAWALQDPDDYMNVQRELVRSLFKDTGIDAGQIKALGIDFTNCTMMPIDKDGNVLCQLEKFRNRPNAWVKLWKHHAAEKYARKLLDLAEKFDEPWFKRYGHIVSAEWLFPKILQIYFEDRDIYDATDTFIEAVDWIVLKMTEKLVRSSATLGVNAFYSSDEGYPSKAFFDAVDKDFGDTIMSKMGGTVLNVGECAGYLTKEYADFLGLMEGTVIATGHGDSEVAACGLGVTTPERMIMVMGTSLCYQYMNSQCRAFEGLCAIVKDGMVPGYYAYEAGQCAVGDVYDWFINNCLPGEYFEEAKKTGRNIYQLMNEKAAAIPVGSTGLVALDWFNGCRSLLMNYDLTGLIMGMTVRTSPEEIYKALVESTAFAARNIIDAFVANDLAVNEIIATGGLALKAPYVVQTFADIIGKPVRVYTGADAGVMGSAVCAAVAYDNARTGKLDFEEVARRMVHQDVIQYDPIPENAERFKDLYNIYIELTEIMGVYANSPMKKLLELRNDNKAGN